MTDIELKHGDFNANLLVCNKAMRLAMIDFVEETGHDESVIFSGSKIAIGEFLNLYAYHSYSIWCKQNREPRINALEFEDKITKQGIKAADSNIEDVFKALVDTIIVPMADAVEKAKEEKKSNATSDGMNSKPSSAAN